MLAHLVPLHAKVYDTDETGALQQVYSTKLNESINTIDGGFITGMNTQVRAPMPLVADSSRAEMCGSHTDDHGKHMMCVLCVLCFCLGLFPK